MKRPATPIIDPKTSSRRRFIGTIGSALGAGTLGLPSTRGLAGAEPMLALDRHGLENDPQAGPG